VPTITADAEQITVQHCRGLARPVILQRWEMHEFLGADGFSAAPKRCHYHGSEQRQAE